jgi:hypothetical protein
MNPPAIEREVEADGTVILRAGPGIFRYRHARPGALFIRVEGDDNGQFGTGLLDEIASVLARERPLEIFVDASAGSMPGLAVNRQWSRFLGDHQRDIRRVHVLVGSRTAELGLAVVRRLSSAGKLIRIYTQRDAFEAQQQKAG